MIKKNIRGIIFSFLVLWAFPFVTHAATITVDSLDDANAIDGTCSLREAIAAADTDAVVDTCTAGSGADTIVMGVPGTVSLTSTLVINSDVHLIGHAGGTVINDFQLYASVSPYNTPQQIFNLIIDDIEFDDTSVVIEGIENSSTVTGDLEVHFNNIHIHNTGNGQYGPRGLEIKVKPFPAPYTRKFYINDSLIENNQKGGVYIDECTTLFATVYIDNTIIRNNTTAYAGGGIFMGCGHLVMTNSTISGNTAGTSGGGIYVDDGFTDDNDDYYPTNTELTNVTIAENVATNSGGGIFASNIHGGTSTAQLSLTHVTLAYNETVGGTTVGGVESTFPTVSLINTAIVDNTGDDCSIVPAPTISTSNVAGDASCGAGFTPNVTAGLGALADNGGTALIGPHGTLGNILTMALQPNSDLFSVADNATCAATDERGVARPLGSGCDVGAYEADDPVVTQLTLNKTVINDDGGTAVDTDFTLTATGPDTITGTEGAAAITAATVSPGVYTLTESGPEGYATGTWSCDGGVLNGTQLSVTAGDTITCTVTNDDVPSVTQLTLNKIVINDDGGTAVDTDFTLTATGPTTITGIEGTTEITSASVDPGTYTLSESGPTGYATGTWSCENGVLSGTQLTISAGESVICTVTNDDISSEEDPKPLAADDVRTGNVGDPITVDVLTNDTENGGTFILATLEIEGAPTPGDVLTVDGEGTWTVNHTTGTITFTPAEGFTQNPTPIIYRITDTSGDTVRARVVISYPSSETNETCSGSIGNHIWLDLNADGIEDKGVEPGIPNVHIKLKWAGPDNKWGNSDDEEWKEKTGNKNGTFQGHYLFENLDKGRYRVIVKEEDVADYVQTYDPTGAVMNTKATVDLGCDEDRLDIDFGFAPVQTELAKTGMSLWDAFRQWLGFVR